MKRTKFMICCTCCILLLACSPIANAQERRHPQREEMMPPHRNRYRVLDDKEFAVLYNKVKKASFAEGKLDLIEVSSLSAGYTAAQCARLMELLTFKDQRLQALRLMSARIVDPRNVRVIYELFTFQSDKEAAARIIEEGR